MSTPATASYFFRTNYGSSGTATGTLADLDLLRDGDPGEAVLIGNGFKIFDGIDVLTTNSAGQNVFIKVPGEILATVTFADGTSFSGIQALRDSVYGSYGLGTEYFLLDAATLATLGKTMADVVNVTRIADTDFNLNWTDFGISGTPVTPILPPPPPPPPVLNRIEGTAGRDTLRGTSGDDLIIGNGGRDTLTGRAGDDTFVFGREASNGVRDIATITDYNAYDDTILLTNNVTIARTIEGTRDVTIVLSGTDGDRIVLKNQPDSGPLYQVQFDPDFFG